MGILDAHVLREPLLELPGLVVSAAVTVEIDLFTAEKILYFGQFLTAYKFSSCHSNVLFV